MKVNVELKWTPLGIMLCPALDVSPFRSQRHCPAHTNSLMCFRCRVGNTADAKIKDIKPSSLRTFGPFAFETRTLQEDFGGQIAAESNKPKETLWLKQILGLAIARGKAVGVLSTLKQDSASM